MILKVHDDGVTHAHTYMMVESELKVMLKTIFV